MYANDANAILADPIKNIIGTDIGRAYKNYTRIYFVGYLGQQCTGFTIDLQAS